MLQGYPTKNGTGISIFGDYGDLKSLYATVHEIADTLNEQDVRLKAQSQLLMNFAYELRKAYSGQRLVDKLVFDGDDQEMNYYGFQCVWTDILIFIAALRYNVGYIRTDKLQQANLYMLEYIVEKAMFNYDPQGANVIREYIGQRINITDQYAFIIYQAIHIKFVSDRPGKKRFRNIPRLIGNHFSEWGTEYKELIRSFELSAKKEGCKVTDLEFSDFPEILW